MVLAMNEAEVLALVLSLGLPFVLAIILLSQRYYGRQRRLEVMQRALESDRLDADTKARLLEALAPPRSEWLQALSGQLAWFARNLVFVAGWITMFTGLGIWIAAEVWGWRNADADAGLIAAFVGFALVSLPLALAELERRRVPDPRH